jgi:hypothetical protein
VIILAPRNHDPRDVIALAKTGRLRQLQRLSRADIATLEVLEPVLIVERLSSSSLRALAKRNRVIQFNGAKP